MDKAAVLDEVRRYAELVEHAFPESKVVLYGSFVSGRADEDSDIDVAVVVKSIKGSFLDSATELFKLARKVDLRISPILLEESRDRSGFLSEVLRTGEVVSAGVGG